MTIALKRRIAQEAAELVKTNVPQRQMELVGELAASLGDLLSALTGEAVRLQITAVGRPEAVDVVKMPPAPAAH